MRPVPSFTTSFVLSLRLCPGNNTPSNAPPNMHKSATNEIAQALMVTLGYLSNTNTRFQS